MISNLVSWLLILIAAINSTAGNIYLKKSQIDASSTSFIATLFTTNFIFGIFFYAINVLLFAKALTKLPVATAYPVLSGISFCLLALSSTYFLGEKLTHSQMLGMGIIIFGIFILGID